MVINNNGRTVLVIGGTGHYGRHIVQALLKRNIPTRVMSRNKEKALQLLGKHSNLELFEGNILEKESVSKCLVGIDAIVISLSAFNRKTIRKLHLIEHDAVLNLLQQASELKIQRILYVSVYEKPSTEIKMLTGKIKREVEEALEKSSFDYTILGAPPSIEIFFSLIRGNKMRVPGGGPSALPNISPIDLGEIAAQAITKAGLQQKRYRLAGPSAPSFSEAASRISKILGKEVQFKPIPLFPLKVAAKIAGLLSPLMPYLAQLLPFILLMNNFESNITSQVDKDYKILQETFDYTPHTLEDHTKLWYNTHDIK
ncbi:MAG: SDR family oxidoreductase [Candidatus Hodarchaeales archaeon]|jgi:uncharacterized protein YbjT (DUF2867 family)